MTGGKKSGIAGRELFWARESGGWGAKQMRDVLGPGSGATVKSARFSGSSFSPCLQKLVHLPLCVSIILSSGLSLKFFKPFFFSPSCLPWVSFSLDVSSFLSPLFQEKGLHSKHMFFRSYPLMCDWYRQSLISPSVFDGHDLPQPEIQKFYKGTHSYYTCMLIFHSSFISIFIERSWILEPLGA